MKYNDYYWDELPMEAKSAGKLEYEHVFVFYPSTLTQSFLCPTFNISPTCRSGSYKPRIHPRTMG